MDMGRMLPGHCGRKTKYPVAVRILVCQPAGNQPVKNAIEGYAIERGRSKRKLDFIVLQRCWRLPQQLQYTDTRWRSACAGTAYLFSDSDNRDGIGSRQEGTRPIGFVC